MSKINIITVTPLGKTQKYRMDDQKSFQHLLSNYCKNNKLREEGMVLLLDNTPLDLSLTPDDCGMSKEVVLFISGAFMPLDQDRQIIEILIDDVYFRIWTNTPLIKCLNAYSERTGVRYNALQYKDYMIDTDLTPDYYGISNGDKLVAHSFK